MFAISALRVEHNTLVKQLQGAFVAHHGNHEHLQKFVESLTVQGQNERNDAEKHAEDRARLKADLASGRYK